MCHATSRLLGNDGLGVVKYTGPYNDEPNSELLSFRGRQWLPNRESQAHAILSTLELIKDHYTGLVECLYNFNPTQFYQMLQALQLFTTTDTCLACVPCQVSFPVTILDVGQSWQYWTSVSRNNTGQATGQSLQDGQWP